MSKIASVLGKPLQCDASTNYMSRLSFAKVLIEVDLLAELPNSITIILPNGVPLSQPVVYETLPKLWPQCRLIGHTISACPQTAAARGGVSQTTDSPVKINRNPVHPSRFGSPVETAAVDGQQGSREMAQGEQPPSPHGAIVEAAARGMVATGGRKKARLTLAVMDKVQDTAPLVPSTIVHVLDDPPLPEDITPTVGKRPVTIRRQYMTRSRSLLVQDTPLALPSTQKGKAPITDTTTVSLGRPDRSRLGVANTSAFERDRAPGLSST